MVYMSIECSNNCMPVLVTVMTMAIWYCRQVNTDTDCNKDALQDTVDRAVDKLPRRIRKTRDSWGMSYWEVEGLVACQLSIAWSWYGLLLCLVSAASE